MIQERKIGIMGGTFNPIHFGHLLLAENAFEYFQLDDLIFLPTGDPPHKANNQIVDKYRRLEMVQMAVEDNLHFDVSTLEIERKGYSYTVDTLKELVSKKPENKYYFIIGADSLEQFTQWKDFKTIFKLCKLIVACRENYDIDTIKKIIADYEDKYNAIIHILSMPQIDISSSEIRKRVEESKTIKYMLPKDIEHYIVMNKLYKSDSFKNN